MDPYTRAILARLRSIDFVLTRNVTPTQARERDRALKQLMAPNTPEAVASVEDRFVAGLVDELQIRIYTPFGKGPFPILLYFHSGGGVLGNLDSEDAICRRFTNLVSCIVISVDYHLAPEYKFPVGPEECYKTLCWTTEHAAKLNGDPARIAVGGMSAGGNIAAVISHMARDRHGPAPVFQLLLVPLTDFRLPDTPSMLAYAEGYLLAREDIVWFTGHYLNSEEEKRNPLASPYLASDFRNLPPALVITAEYDPLRDDGERYAHRLKEAGVQVRLSRRAGAVHGFLVPNQLNPVLHEASAALRDAFQLLQVVK